MNKSSKWIFIIIIAVIAAGAMGWFGYIYWNGYFADKAVESIPFPGKDYREPTDDAYDEIRVSEPNPSQAISSPLTIRGSARGTWFFEGSFPISLVDSNGEVVATGYVSTAGDWMTEDFVDFEGTLRFEAPDAASGVLILRNDNPSGRPENSKEYQVPINFANDEPVGAISNFIECAQAGYPVMESHPRQCRTPDGQTFVEELGQAECRPTGCSGQICSDEDVASTCEYLPEYDCYKTAVCERQENGECGWTMTDELRACLENS